MGASWRRQTIASQFKSRLHMRLASFLALSLTFCINSSLSVVSSLKVIPGQLLRRLTAQFACLMIIQRGLTSHRSGVYQV